MMSIQSLYAKKRQTKKLQTKINNRKINNKMWIQMNIDVDKKLNCH